MERIERVFRWMEKEGLESLLIEDPIDLYYLTQIRFSLAKLLFKKGEALLFLDGRYLERGKKEAPCKVFPLDQFSDFLEGEVFFDSSFLSVEAFYAYQKRFPNVEWKKWPSPLRDFRLIKDSEEIALLKRAAKITWEGYQHLLSLLKEGIQEIDLAREFEFFCRKAGAEKLSFEPIIAFGANSAYPHYRAGSARLKRDQIVLFDLGAVYEHYSADMTRIHFFGKKDPELERFYQIVRRAQREALEKICPGISFGALDRVVKEAFSKEGMEELYLHSLGHGIGLETHEYPRIKSDLELKIEPGMVFTVEPGLYKAGLGGVRYEDTVVATESGFENFFTEEA